MKYFATAAALVCVVPRVVSLTMDTPNRIVQCQPQLLTWSAGIAPYYLTIIPGGQPSAPALKSFDTTSATSETWLVDIPAGNSITMALKDSTGATAFTDMVTIQPNSDSSCLSGGSSPGPNPGNSGNAGPPAVTQAADVTSATSSATVVRSGVSFSTTAAGGATSILLAPTQTLSRGAGTPASTPSRSATANTSGAECRFSFSGFGFAGVLGLVGAMFLYL